jgi:hypothetical protein
MIGSITAADTRAAHAALDRPQDSDRNFDRHLLIDDTDEFEGRSPRYTWPRQGGTS